MNTSKKPAKNRGFYGKFSWRFAGGYDTFILRKAPEADGPLSGSRDRQIVEGGRRYAKAVICTDVCVAADRLCRARRRGVFRLHAGLRCPVRFCAGGAGGEHELFHGGVLGPVFAGGGGSGGL